MAQPAQPPDPDLSEVGPRALVPPPRRRSPPLGWWLLALLILALAAGGWWLQRRRDAPPSQEVQALPAPVTAPAESAVAPASAAPGSVAAADEPVPEPQVAEGPLAPADVASAVAALAGQSAATKLLISDDFAYRFVATIDNLDRDYAPARLWPVQPTEGRFQVVEREGRTYADPDNAARYTPWVLLTEQVDPRAAVALYGRMLPLLQSAYEDLGYPGRRFHARLIAVIDHLLEAPDAPERLALTLTEVKGEVPSQRPWVRYEFADPALQSASAGHKIMLRVGAVNERRLKVRLRALREELVRQAQR